MLSWASTSRNSTRILFLESTIPRGEFVKQLTDMVFTQPNLMFKYIDENIIHCDRFFLIIPYDQLANLLNDPVFKFVQVKLIHVYCDDGSNLQEYTTEYIMESEKLRFCHQWRLEAILKKIKAENVVDSQVSNFLLRLKDVASSWKSNIAQKRSSGSSAQSPKPKRLHMDNDLFSYFCSVCISLLRQPHQLECGHRICKPCINNDKKQTECRTCSIASMNVKIRPDRGFERDIQSLSVYCSLCPWTGTYQDYTTHRNQHPDEISLANQISSDYNPYVWKITDFGQKLDDARSGRQLFIDSPAFRTSPTGYKMCLRLYPSGDIDVNGKYLSIFLVILKGDRDDVLPWPFPFNVTVRLIDQSNENNHFIDSFRPDINSIACQKPTSDMNSPFGIKACVPCGHFQENMNRYVQNDAMSIEFKIEMPNESIDHSPRVAETPNDGKRGLTHH